MKHSVMISIFYSFLLIIPLTHYSIDEKAIKTQHIADHCKYLNNLILPVEIFTQLKLTKKQIKNLITNITQITNFKTSLIKACLDEIQKTHSLHYMTRLWNMLNSYCFLDNELLKKEYCVLMLLIYRNTAATYYKDQTATCLSCMVSYYESIDNKQLNELLKILNIIAQELKPLLETMQNSQITLWREWISKYWFKLFMVTLVISVKIMLYQKANSSEKTYLLNTGAK